MPTAIMEAVYVQGLDIGSSEGNRRQGELLVVEDHSGAKHTFKFVAEYQYPIPE